MKIKLETLIICSLFSYSAAIRNELLFFVSAFLLFNRDIFGIRWKMQGYFLRFGYEDDNSMFHGFSIRAPY